MANNYMLSSFVVDAPDKAQRVWLADACDQFERASCGDSLDGDTLAEQLGVDLIGGWGWRCEVTNGRKGEVLFYTEESGNVDAMVTLLQEYLEFFNPLASIGFEWADTCSKMRPGEFGGGAVFIAANVDPVFTSTSGFLAEQQAKWRRNNRNTR